MGAMVQKGNINSKKDKIRENREEIKKKGAKNRNTFWKGYWFVCNYHTQKRSRVVPDTVDAITVVIGSWVQSER